MSCVCGYSSQDRSNLRRHIRSCKMERDRQHSDLIESLRTTRKSLIEAQAMISQRDIALIDSRREVEHLRKKLQRREATSRITNVRDCNICIYNSVYPHSKEGILLPQAIVDPLLRTPSESVPRFIQLKHFTGPNIARNIHLPNRRGNTIQVVEECDGVLRWVHRDRKTTLDTLFERHLNELRNVYGAESVETWMQWYQGKGLSDETRRHTIEWKEQLGKLDLVLINHQRDNNELTDAYEEESSQ